MRIGVDATTWSNRRGYGRFTRALLTALVYLDKHNHYTFFADYESEEFPLPAGVEICRVTTKAPTIKAAGADSNRSLSDLWRVARAFRSATIDLLYFPTDYSYVPGLMGVPRIVTIHDAISELFPELVFPTLRSKMLYRAKVRSGIRQARMLVTVSEYSRRRLMEKLKIPQHRFRIVSEAADPVFRPLECPLNGEVVTRWGVPADSKCVIYVGGFSPHKNLFVLLDAVRTLCRQPVLHNMRLLLVGDHTGDPFFSCYDKLVECVRELELEQNVVFTGHLRDEQLVMLLNRADVLVLPSACEGFGLPGVEAAACGTPIVATTESPLPDLLGDGVLAVEPGNGPGWRSAIERVLTDSSLRERMRRGALTAASCLSWENSARQLLSIFHEVVQNGAVA